MVRCKYKLSTFGETKRLSGADGPLQEPILFREKLYVFDENGKRIGRFSLNIDQEEGEFDHKLFYVHISNRAFINGKLSESVVTGTVTGRLKTLEEIRYECTEISESGKHERSVFLLRETTKYYLSIMNSICDIKNQNVSTISFVEALGLVGECANAVLMRKLATNGYEGILCQKALLSNGKLCRNYYVTRLSNQFVNGKKMEVLIIYRNVTNHRKCNVTMTLALTRTGQIVYLFWSNSKCFLHIDPDVEINPIHFTYAEPELHTHWHKDVQLYSNYLDRVDYQKMIYRSYRYQREPLTRMLSDFVEYAILVKPEDIVCFAIQYFTAFGHGLYRQCRDQTWLFPQFFAEYQEEEESSENRYAWPEENVYYAEKDLRLRSGNLQILNSFIKHKREDRNGNEESKIFKRSALVQRSPQKNTTYAFNTNINEHKSKNNLDLLDIIRQEIKEFKEITKEELRQIRRELIVKRKINGPRKQNDKLKEELYDKITEFEINTEQYSKRSNLMLDGYQKLNRKKQRRSFLNITRPPQK